MACKKQWKSKAAIFFIKETYLFGDKEGLWQRKGVYFYKLSGKIIIPLDRKNSKNIKRTVYLVVTLYFLCAKAFILNLMRFVFELFPMGHIRSYVQSVVMIAFLV